MVRAAYLVSLEAVNLGSSFKLKVASPGGTSCCPTAWNEHYERRNFSDTFTSMRTLESCRRLDSSTGRMEPMYSGRPRCLW